MTARPPVRFVAHNAHRQMDLAGMRARAGRNRIEARLERFQLRDEFRRIEFYPRKGPQQIDDIFAQRICGELAVSRAQQFAQFRIAGLLRNELDQRLGDAGDLVPAPECFAQ